MIVNALIKLDDRRNLVFSISEDGTTFVSVTTDNIADFVKEIDFDEVKLAVRKLTAK